MQHKSLGLHSTQWKHGFNCCIRDYAGCKPSGVFQPSGPIHTGCGTPSAMRRKQMGPVDVNGDVHTACKQYQRKNIPICARVASRVLCGLGLTPSPLTRKYISTNRIPTRPTNPAGFPFKTSQVAKEQPTPNFYLPMSNLPSFVIIHLVFSSSDIVFL